MGATRRIKQTIQKEHSKPLDKEKTLPKKLQQAKVEVS